MLIMVLTWDCSWFRCCKNDWVRVCRRRWVAKRRWAMSMLLNNVLVRGRVCVCVLRCTRACVNVRVTLWFVRVIARRLPPDALLLRTILARREPERARQLLGTYPVTAQRRYSHASLCCLCCRSIFVRRTAHAPRQRGSFASIACGRLARCLSTCARCLVTLCLTLLLCVHVWCIHCFQGGIVGAMCDWHGSIIGTPSLSSLPHSYHHFVFSCISIYYVVGDARFSRCSQWSIWTSEFCRLKSWNLFNRSFVLIGNVFFFLVDFTSSINIT